MLSTPPPSPPTPQVPSMMNHSGLNRYDKMHMLVGGNGSGSGLLGGGRWGRRGLRVGECGFSLSLSVFIPFFKLQSTYSRELHNCWQMEMFLFVDGGRYADWREKSCKQSEDTLRPWSHVYGYFVKLHQVFTKYPFPSMFGPLVHTQTAF